VTQGPYYPDLNKVRGDITEGRPGAALDLRMTVVDATRCTPIKDAAVDIWHCDTCAEVVKQRNGDGMVGEEFIEHARSAAA
jgi:protocatechuate 3,4-dioxygenase beta subunit